MSEGKTCSFGRAFTSSSTCITGDVPSCTRGNTTHLLSSEQEAQLPFQAQLRERFTSKIRRDEGRSLPVWHCSGTFQGTSNQTVLL